MFIPYYAPGKDPMQKAQSSLEYLSTYAWAIIIIAVVVGVLYSLGVFNLNGLTARAQPGACQVYRPYGPGTVMTVTLQGLCSGIEPKFVAVFQNSDSRITISNYSYINPTSEMTISAWVYANSTTSADEYVISKGASTGYVFPEFKNGASDIAFDLCLGTTSCTSQLLTANYPSTGAWHFVAATYNGKMMSIYIDGQLAGSQAASGNIGSNSNDLIIGATGTNWFEGEVSNIQIYNTSLSANQIYRLYTTGIGAPPTQLQNLAAWWPLNQNTEDYSGNGGTAGTANSMIFVAGWGSGYSH